MTYANGNLVAKGADTFGFDQANRMTSATVAAVNETYAYDGDGTRFSRQVGTNPVIRYVTDVGAGLPLTTTGRGSMSTASASPTSCRARPSRSTTPIDWDPFGH